MENKIRSLIKEKIIPKCKEIQLLESKDITDIVLATILIILLFFLFKLNIMFYLMEE